MNERPLVLYHADCTDGFASAWVARRKMPNAECVPVQYGQEPPRVTDREVYVLDFSYKASTLRMMADLSSQLVCLDHHKTAQEDLRSITDADPYPDRTHGWRLNGNGFYDKVYVKFDMNKSGARMAWDYFFPPSSYSMSNVVPDLVKYVEDRDLWRWSMPNSREVNAAIASYDKTFEEFDRLYAALQVEHGYRELATEGSAILRYQGRLIESACKNAHEATIGGHSVLAVNTGVSISEVAERLAKDRPFGVCYFRRADGLWIYSLRSREGGVDVSAVAKQYGGGGHKQAAGFESNTVL